MSHVTSAATAFTGSYVAATAEGAPGDGPSLQRCAAAMSAHYGPKLCAFTLGAVHQVASPAEASAGTLAHLSRLAASGVGTDIRMVRSTVREVSPASAIVFVTWEVRSRKQGVAGWKWKNVYGFRLGPEEGAKGHWEWINSDNEITELLKRVPNYFEL